ncbi:MAG: SsrA-binding protein SmpB [Planctomycetes bacterium]|nr:SsrA-binding protein SmpB [Planctomycetota bacterium]
MSGKVDPDRPVVAVNKKARHEYVVLETIECGIELSGSEVKSIRGRNSSIQEAYGKILDGEAWLFSMTIGPYENARENPDPIRRRKLLLKKREIEKIFSEVRIKGRTWIPLKLYFRGPWLKVEMAVCVGKRQYDKREAMKAQDARREIAREAARRR